MPISTNWFNVDKDGLAKLLRRRGMQFVLFELLQNAWDTDTTRVDVEINAIPNRAAVELIITDDDPDGFRNLDHAYTLFAESERKGVASKRGRFNLGEKLVLAVCEQAVIESTKGSVYFTRGGRKQSKKKRETGTRFYAIMQMTRAELDQMLNAANLIIPPVPTKINERPYGPAPALHSMHASLAIDLADDEGVLRRSRRLTSVNVYELVNGQAWLYEMGIPVVEIDFPWSVEIMQKIPLNLDRDNVTPAYLQEIRVAVMNEMHEKLDQADAARPEVVKVLEDKRTLPAVVNTILTHQYGEKRAIADPSDPEANHQLVAEGYNLIHGRSFSHEAWRQIKEAGAARPAGQIKPTYKPYSADGKPAAFIPVDKWTAGMNNIAQFVIDLGELLLQRKLEVRFEKNRFTDPWAANYGNACLTFNRDKLGKRWFEQPRKTREIIDLIIHEFAHESVSSHLDERFHRACTRLGAELALLALEHPIVFIDE